VLVGIHQSSHLLAVYLQRAFCYKIKVPRHCYTVCREGSSSHADVVHAFAAFFACRSDIVGELAPVPGQMVTVSDLPYAQRKAIFLMLMFLTHLLCSLLQE
jgi:hypothetical protein